MSLATLAAQLNIASRQARSARAVPSLWLLSDAQRLADPRPFMSSVPSFWKIALKAGKAPRGSSLARVHMGRHPWVPISGAR